jgi:hypothetical protein
MSRLAQVFARRLQPLRAADALRRAAHAIELEQRMAVRRELLACLSYEERAPLHRVLKAMKARGAPFTFSEEELEALVPMWELACQRRFAADEANRGA